MTYSFTLFLWIASPANASKKRAEASTPFTFKPMPSYCSNTSSNSFLRSKPLFTKMQYRFLPIALCNNIAATEESTPPDNPRTTLSFPTLLLMRQRFLLQKNLVSNLDLILQYLLKSFLIIVFHLLNDILLDEIEWHKLFLLQFYKLHFQHHVYLLIIHRLLVIFNSITMTHPHLTSFRYLLKKLHLLLHKTKLARPYSLYLMVLLHLQKNVLNIVHHNKQLRSGFLPLISDKSGCKASSPLTEIGLPESITAL